MFLHELLRAVEALEQAGDPGRLVEAIPRIASEAFGFERAAFCSLEGDTLRLQSAYFADDPDKAGAILQQAPELALDFERTQPEWRAMSGAKPVWASAESGSVLCGEFLGLTDCLLAPVASGGRVLGILAAGSTGSSQRPEQLLEAVLVFSRMCAHGMHSLRVQEESALALSRTRRRVAELTVHEQLAGTLRAAGGVAEVLKILIDEIHTVVDYDYAAAAVFESEEDTWVCASRGPDDEPIVGLADQLAGISRDDLAPTVAMLAKDLAATGPPLADLHLGESLTHLYVPMYAEHAIFGFVILGSRSGNSFRDVDLRFADTITGTAAVVIDNLRLYSRSLKSEERMRSAFAQIGTALASGLDVDETLWVVVQLAASITQADGASLLMLESEERTLGIRASHGLSSEFKAGTVMPAGKTFAHEVIQRRQRRLLNDGLAAGVVTPVLTDGRPARSIVAVPIILHNLPRGVIEVYSHSPNYFSNDDLELLGWFAGHAAIALRNAEAFKHEKNIAEVFQSSLLIVPTPDIEGYDLGAEYAAALEEAKIGGDFYDFIPLADGKFGIVIGDVSGKGLGAAVYTAMGKYMLRAYAVESPSPSSVLKRVNNALCQYTEQSTFITLFYAVLDPRNNTLVHSSAGHEPALVWNEEAAEVGQMRVGGAALGIILDAEYPEETWEMQPGDALLLYTDGVTEAASDGQFLEIDGLTKIFRRNCSFEAQRMVENIYQETVDYSGGRVRDDIVLVAIARRSWD